MIISDDAMTSQCLNSHLVTIMDSLALNPIVKHVSNYVELNEEIEVAVLGSTLKNKLNELKNKGHDKIVVINFKSHFYLIYESITVDTTVTIELDRCYRY